MSVTLSVTSGVRAALRDQEPTQEQWAAIAAPLGPAHVIAGAGSGKTAVMAARIVYLVEQAGVAPSAVLGLTFTNKAAAELEERIRDALVVRGPGAGDEVTVDTYHAFSAELVKAYGVRVGVEPDADLLSEAQQYQILLAILDGERFEHLSVRSAGFIIRKTLELAAACADHLTTPDRVAAASLALLDRAEAGERLPDWQVQAARERIELARLVERYVAEKRRRGRIDFGDQVAKAVELVEGQPEIAAALRARFPHVLLDEYQDTNIAQRRLMQCICRHGTSIMAVGDARQAIYAFRGATMYNLLSFSEHFPAVDPALDEPLPLSTNFRSGRRILELANAVIEAVPNERRGGRPLVPLPANGEGEVRAALLTDQYAEAAFIADQVARAHAEGLPYAAGSHAEGLSGAAGSHAEGLSGAAGTRAERLPGTGGSQAEGLAVVTTGGGPPAVAGRAGGPAGPDLGDGRIWPAWRDIAVLVRSKRLLGPIREALEQRDVPVEVVGLSGLLETPEIVDLVSMLRVIDDPGANVALTRVLLGPRWRIGYRHLVRLARWASRHNRGLKEGLPGEDPDPGDVSFALSEALDHLDEVEGLDEESLARLEAFREELRQLRDAADAPLLDLVQTVLERTWVWAELEASSDRRATSARQNLATFLDRVAEFAPVEGDPSLPAFLAYLDAVEEAVEPVEATQPAPADSVKLMTVHMAKGLEFPMVVVAGLAAGSKEDGSPKHGIFPDVRISDPRRAQGFPYELREDAGHLPRFGGNSRAFQAALAERALEDERRLFYVACTRAKQLLVLTAAWWYQGSDKTPKGPGPFWREAAEHPAVDVLVRASEPVASPLPERLRSRVRWPPPARRPADVDDPLFPEGWAGAVELARGDPAALAARVPPDQGEAFRAALDAQRHLVELASAHDAPARPEAPRILSVTQVLTYDRCPQAFYWTVVRPLPAPPRPAARLGSVVHRLLERRARGLPDLVDVGDLGGEPAGTAAQPGLVERAARNFAATRFARLPAPEAEVGVALRAGPWVVRGRIDAVFNDGGVVEVVDWKTGRAVGTAPDGLDQLGLYTLALRELGRLPADSARASYCYLGGEEPRIESTWYGPAELDAQRARLEAALASIAAGEFGRACGRSDCESCGQDSVTS